MKMRLAIPLLLLPLLLQAQSLRSLVKTGNEAYKAGEFDEALNAYRQAQLEAPDDALGKFNEGAALYRKEDLDGAAELEAKHVSEAIQYRTLDRRRVVRGRA